MKISKYLLALLLLVGYQNTQAQEEEYTAYFNYEDYDWEEDQARFEGEIDDSTAAIITKEKYIYNYYYNEEDRFAMQRLYHQRVYLNSTRALEEYNRVYLPSGEGNELLKFRARAFTGDKVIEIDEDDIQTGQLEDDPEQEYDYFAFEGLEVGSEIEYYYVNEREPSTSGLSVTFQDEYEILDFEFDLISPWNLAWKTKIYNLPDSVIEDTALEYENRYYFKTAVPAYEEEPVTPADALKGRVIFALDRNLYNGAKDITSYNYTAQNIITYVTKDLSRKERKVIKKEAENASEYLADTEPDLGLGLRVEHYIKDNYSYYNAGFSDLRDLEFVEENKVFNGSGALQLYARIFDELGLEYELVYTSNRYQLQFDGDFQTTNFLSELLIYVIDEDLYIDPSENVSRNNLINHNFTGTDALFMSKTDLGGEIVAITDIREIPFQPASFTVDTILAKVNLGPDLLDNSVDVYRALTGYSARSYQGIFELIDDEDDLEEIEESLISYIDEEGTVEDLELTHDRAIYMGRQPLQAKGTLKDVRIIENAGSDILLNVGKLIGPQMEMYDEDSVRNFDIYNAYTRTYYREIEFEIPEGYRLADPEKLKFDVRLNIDGVDEAIFVSDYTIEGNQVKVVISEYYEGFSYPKAYFQEYLAVVNAAADFNKVSVLFEKEI